MPKRTSGPKRKAEKRKTDEIKAPREPPSLKDIFDGYKKDFPPELLKPLANPPQILSQEKPVYVLVYIKRNHWEGDKFKIMGIYSSLSLANQAALDVFKEKSEFWECYNISPESEYDSRFFHCKSGRFDISLSLDNTIQWRISDSGALALYVSGADSDTHKAYVQLHSVQSNLVEASKSDPAGPNKRRKMDNNDSDDSNNLNEGDWPYDSEDQEDHSKTTILGGEVRSTEDGSTDSEFLLATVCTVCTIPVM